MPINAFNPNPSNRLAYPDSIGPVPRNEYLGALADFLAKSYSPERTQQMRGVAELLSLPAISRTVDMLSYGEPLTTGAGGLGGTTRPKADVVEAGLAVAPLTPAAALQSARLARQAALAGDKAAMAVGKVGERYAERVVPQVMARGGMPAQLLGDLSQGSIRPMDVWHGSPHGPFERFDPTKIGTGEGAQAYSFGHYLGEARKTGEGYRDTLAYKAFDVGPEAEKLGLNLSAGTRGEFIRQTRADKPPEVLARQLQNANIAARDLPQDKLAELFRQYKEKGGGYLYKIDLPDEEIAKMLDWDKPLTKQPSVMGALRSEAEQRVRDRALVNIENDIRASLPKQDIGNDYMAMFSDANVVANKDIQKQALDKLNKMDLSSLVDKELDTMKPADMNWNMTGKEFYESLAKREGSPANASAMLQRQGVPGTRYLDAGSRNPGGRDTSNFVVYPGNENLLTIKEINDKPVNGLREAASKSGLSNIKDKFKDVDLDVYENKGTINLSKIVVPKDMRSSGVGTNVMNDLIKYADETGQRIVLTPSGDFGGNVSRLKDFYKDFGFVENKGRNKDFTTRETMIRDSEKNQLRKGR